MKIKYGFLPLAFLLISCTETPIRHSDVPLSAVDKVDLNRYLGTWYEIASRPNRFQKGCVATKATYSLEKDNRIKILNECRNESLTGKPRSAEGHAWAVDDTNAKLKVTFFRPFTGDYWILELGANYEYSVIGEPDGRYLWILSRTPKMDEKVYQGILDRLKSRGYDVSAVSRTLQP